MKPTTRPKLKCSKRSSNGILVSYTYKESSKWGRDTVEIEAKARALQEYTEFRFIFGLLQELAEWQITKLACCLS